MTEGLIRLSPLESAVDDAIGEAEAEPALPTVPEELAPLEALEEALLPALLRPPCFVMFSGGRDSSVVLAVAARAARKEGLELPIPITHVFPNYPETDETGWQSLVLRHIGLRDHHRQVFGSEFNLLGPAVRESIRQHGLIAPAASQLFVPTLAEARRGSVITGLDGDGLFNGGSFAHVRAVFLRHERPTLRTPLSIGRALTLRGVRQVVAGHRDPSRLVWLRPEARERIRTLDAAESATEPLLWNRYVSWWARRRHVVSRSQALAELARVHEVQLVHPLMDKRFLAAVSQWGGRWGWGRRAAALRAQFGGLLPNAVLSRESKADFTRAYWGADTRDFIEEWDGAGLPDDLVDPEALRGVWRSDQPDARTGLLLHAAWAAASGASKIKEPFNCRLQ
jgi:asparagine synthase (glutamine-hydrolysing)